MNSAIAQAVEPLRSEAIERARKNAAEYVDRMFAAYAADCTAFDYPVGLGTPNYKVQRARYQAFHSVASAVKAPSFGNVKRPDGKADLYARNEEKITKFIEAAAVRAGEQYTAFIEKLEKKVGAHTAATLEGSHVWFTSLLTVTKADGSVEHWSTQQIWNTSPLGLVFPQWPSRKVKG